MAERLGFEPRVGFKPTHAFQACALSHSAISPANVSSLCGSRQRYAIFFLAQSAKPVANGRFYRAALLP